MRAAKVLHRGRYGRQAGQALLIAVLLMGVILLLGILFAAIVSYNQEQSVRHVDQVAAELQAEAGIQYANSMLESSPQGADWRPHFVAYDPATYDADDPATWPSPPAMYADGTTDPNFYGPDGASDTDDDYYSDFEVVRGWFPLRAGTVTAPGAFTRLGYFRFPDPNQLAAGGAGTDQPTMGRGYFLLQVTYDPDPPYEPGDPTSADRMSGCTRIVSIGRAIQDSNVFRRKVAYKPLGLPDHLLWVTNDSGQAGDATIGTRPGVDLNRSGAVEAGESLLTDLDGPIRCNSRLVWVGEDLDSSSSTTPSLTFNLRSAPSGSEGYLRDDYFFAAKGLESLDGASATGGGAVSVNGGAATSLPLTLNSDDNSEEANRVYTGNHVPALAAPRLDNSDPNSGVSRYLALTRDSGEVTVLPSTVSDPEHGLSSGQAVNTGLYGHGAGVYIDNDEDIQFADANGESNLKTLMDDWMRRLTSNRLGGDSGWNATYTTYAPPGVEIEFFPSQAAVLATCSSGTYSTTPPSSPGVLWWPNHAASGTEPGIKITRHDKRWRRGDSGNVGADSGQNVMVVSYPRYPNQVIFAEGNVRVKGVLPAASRDASGNLQRDYNVTVVSNGTIYIDGQLMTPQDVSGRDSTGSGSGVRDEDNTNVALLAKDCVCLNPTQLVPQLTSGLVTAAADDAANPSLDSQHWELYPDSGGVAYTQWRFGWPYSLAPGSAVPSGVAVNLVALAAGADPGPSGLGMTVYNSGTATTTPVTFPGTSGVVDPYTFMFVPPGARIPTAGLPVAAPTAYASTAIAPNWQVPGSTPYSAFANPNVPFNLSSYVALGVGASNVVSLFHRDPQLGPASTPLLLKKWKIEEATLDSGSGYYLPRAAVHGHVNALMFAQRGCWFVIPGEYFDTTAATQDFDGNGTIDPLDSLYAARFLHYNYDITVRGCITQDHTAPLDMVQDWTRKWAYPIYSGTGNSLALSWGTLRYEFDERLRSNRDQSLTTLSGTVRSAAKLVTSPESSLPKLPCLPSSPTLTYSGGMP